MNKIFYITVVLFFAAITGMVYADSVESDLRDGLVRLHVIANSDSEFDQQVKLLVRDEILQSAGETIRRNGSRDAVIESTAAFSQTAQKKLRDLGVEYDAQVCVENFYFPRKSYDGITLPAGRYKSIRVVLGEGKGQNWWCVAYPPLCFTESTFGELSPEGKKILQKQLSPESYDLISGTELKIEYKFKIVEWVQLMKEKMNKN